MKKSMGKLTLFALLLSLALPPERGMAQDMSGTNSNTNTAAAPAKKSKNKSSGTSTESGAKTKTVSFKGKLASVDTVNMCFKLDEKTDRTFAITSETLFMKGGKPAISTDAVVGDMISGTYQKTADGKFEAVKVNFSGSATAAKPAAKAKKSASKSTKPPIDTGATTNSVPDPSTPIAPVK